MVAFDFTSGLLSKTIRKTSSLSASVQYNVGNSHPFIYTQESRLSVGGYLSLKLVVSDKKEMLKG